MFRLYNFFETTSLFTEVFIVQLSIPSATLLVVLVEQLTRN